MNQRQIDMAGKRFSSIVAISPSGKATSGDTKWLFKCDCGTEFVANGYYARSGKITTCKVCAAERTRIASVKHGMSATPEFEIWTGMQTRCYNKNSSSFKNYGGRGISICDEWKNSFENFLRDMGKRPSPKHSIERSHNDGDYEPSNCKWATPEEQANNRRTNVNVTIDGITKPLGTWAKEFGIHPAGAYKRYRDGLRELDLFSSRAKKITHNGITDTFSGWSNRTGIKTQTIAMRISKYGWTPEKAVTTGALS